MFEGRRGFTTDQWREVLIRSIGMEPAELDAEVQWHVLARMIPFVENNYNVCELGPRGTGKSHIYKECSPNSILVSGGQTTVANLFYNMSSRRIGLVGMWDLVAFDEVAGISFKDKDGVQIMKDYMAPGSFARGREQMEASASMVFVGNINQSVESLVKTSHLLTPFPDAMIDAAFFDRFHAYIPGWEIPKMRPSFFTQRYGFIVDYLAEFFREMRKRSFADAIDQHFRLGDNLNQRDVIAVRKTVSGLLKLLHPHGKYQKDDVRQCLEYALQVRRRVKEQLKKIGGMEFYDVHFSYIDKETLEEHFVSVKEQGGGGLIPEGLGKPGVVHTIGLSDKGMPGVYRIELQITAGSGKLAMSGLWNSTAAKEQVKMALRLLQGQRQPHQCIQQGAGARLPPACGRPAEHRRAARPGPGQPGGFCLGTAGQAHPESDGGTRRHEPGWQPKARGEPGRVPSSRLRRRWKASHTAHGQRCGHPHHSRRAVYQVPDQLLC